MKKLETLGFKHFCMTVGNLPSSYVESLSYYECLLWLIKYLQEEVIPTVNNNSEVVEELQGLYLELKSYVDNYFDNLDVQEEIDNKLDEMVEEGTLQEIIAEYLNSKAVFGYDTVADLKLATNLINGSYAKTLGYHSKNDGGMATYKIRTITNDDVVDEATIISLYDDTLIAELIVNDYVTPEMFGAYGDNTHDDTTSLNIMFSQDYKNIVMNNDYYVATSLNLIQNKNITGNGKIRFGNDTNGNINLYKTSIDGIDLIAPGTAETNTYHVVKGSDYKLSNLTIEGIIGINSVKTDTPSNIYLYNCTIKGLYRDISLLGLVNNIKVENCKFSRDYTHTTPVTPDHHVYLYSNNLNSNVVTTDFIACKGKNIEFKNCEFGRCAAGKRDLILINFKNISIDEIVTNNGELVNNDTDDIITMDLCNDVKISNVDIDWSGENGIDILTCENVLVSNCDIKNCDYAAISLDHSDVGSVFGFGEGVNKNNKNVLITGCYLESTRACSLFVTTAYATKVTNCTLTNKYVKTDSFYGKLIQIAVNSTGGKIMSLAINNNNYVYNPSNIQVWAYPGTAEQLAVFDSWNSHMEVDEEIGRVITLENPNISSSANVINVNLPLRRMKAYLLNTNDNNYYDVTGIVMIKRPGQTENDVISRGGAYLAGLNKSGSAINANISFGDYISNTPINNSNAYSAPYGATSGTVKIVMY